MKLGSVIIVICTACSFLWWIGIPSRFYSRFTANIPGIVSGFPVALSVSDWKNESACSFIYKFIISHRFILVRVMLELQWHTEHWVWGENTPWMGYQLIKDTHSPHTLSNILASESSQSTYWSVFSEARWNQRTNTGHWENMGNSTQTVNQTRTLEHIIKKTFRAVRWHSR